MLIAVHGSGIWAASHIPTRAHGGRRYRSYVDALSARSEVNSPSAAENSLQITCSSKDGGPGLGRLSSAGLQLPT